MSQTTLDRLTSRLPGPGMPEELLPSQRASHNGQSWFSVVSDQLLLFPYTPAMPISLILLKKVKSISTAEPLQWVSPLPEISQSTQSSTITSNRSLPKDHSFKKGARHQAHLGRYFLFPSPIFWWAEGIKIPPLSLLSTLQSLTAMNKMDRLKELCLQTGRCLSLEGPLESGVHKGPRAKSRKERVGASFIDTRSSREREKTLTCGSSPKCSIFLCKRY